MRQVACGGSFVVAIGKDVSEKEQMLKQKVNHQASRKKDSLQESESQSY